MRIHILQRARLLRGLVGDAIGLSPLGAPADLLLVRRDLQAIFDVRAAHVARMVG